MQSGPNRDRTTCRARLLHSCATGCWQCTAVRAVCRFNFSAVVLYGRHDRWALSTVHSATLKSAARRKPRTTGQCSVQGTPSCTPSSATSSNAAPRLCAPQCVQAVELTGVPVAPAQLTGPRHASYVQAPLKTLQQQEADPGSRHGVGAESCTQTDHRATKE